VVVGAGGAEVARLLPPQVITVDNPHHEQGMGSSLRVGLQAVMGSADEPGVVEPGGIDAVLVMLVDLPGVGPEVIERVIAAAGSAADAHTAILRAGFNGRPGHPVLIGRKHWLGVIETAVGDRGARDYLSAHPARLIECGDVGTGEDIDTQA
jgi:CTP:molybdopterin cytidylyltransferase MocA